jgi:hypothetical protein
MFHGVVFMGTPHGGSDIAFWASYAGNLVSAISFGTRTNKDLLGVLRNSKRFSFSRILVTEVHSSISMHAYTQLLRYREVSDVKLPGEHIPTPHFELF